MQSEDKPHNYTGQLHTESPIAQFAKPSLGRRKATKQASIWTTDTEPVLLTSLESRCMQHNRTKRKRTVDANKAHLPNNTYICSLTESRRHTKAGFYGRYREISYTKDTIHERSTSSPELESYAHSLFTICGDGTENGSLYAMSSLMGLCTPEKTMARNITREMPTAKSKPRRTEALSKDAGARG